MSFGDTVRAHWMGGLQSRSAAPDLVTSVVPALLYIALLWTGLVHHALSQDELQAWALAVASRSPLDLWHRLDHEGHPALWHLLLWLASRVTGAPWALKLVQGSVATAWAWLLWRRMPFGFGEKLLLSLGYFFVFEYAVMSRSYGLGVLLAAMAIDRYLAAGSGRGDWIWPWVLLGLAANTSFYGALLGGGVGLWMLADLRGREEVRFAWAWSRPGMIVAVVLGLIALGTMWPAAGTEPPIEINPPWSAERVGSAWAQLGRAFLPISRTVANGFWEPMPFSQSGSYLVLALVVGLLVAHCLRGDRKALCLIGFVTLGAGLMTAARYSGSMRHIGTIFVAFVLMAWVARYRRVLRRASFTLLLACNAVGGLQAVYGQTLRPFSRAADTAAWLRQRALDQGTIIGHDMSTVAVAAYLQRPFLFADCQCEGTYTVWTADRNAWIRRDHDRNGASLAEFLSRTLADRGGTPILIDIGEPYDVSVMAAAGLRLVRLARFDGVADTDENFDLYRVEALVPAR